MTITRTAQWNGGFLSTGGLLQTFSRNVATRDLAGSAVGVDTPRYARPELIPAAHTGPTSVLAIAGQGQVMACGYDADGTTKVWVVLNQLTGALQVRRSTFATLHSVDITVSGSTRDALSGAGTEAAMAAAGISADLFSQNHIAGSDPTGYADESWIPKSAAVCHGLIVLFCHIGHIANLDDHTVAGNWKKQKIGIAYAKVSDIVANVNTAWKRHAISNAVTAETNAALAIGAFWSLSGYWVETRNNAAPTTAWFCFADYHNHPYAFGAICGLLRATRPSSSSGVWTLEAVAEAPITTSSRLTRATSALHAHSAGFCGNGSGGGKLLCSLGDGTGNACILQYDFSSSALAAYTTGMTDAGTNWYVETASGSSGFGVGPGPGSGAGIVNGYIDADGTVGAGEYDDQRPAYQPVAFCPGPVAGSFLVGSDESTTALCMIVPGAAATDKLTFTAVWAPSRIQTHGAPTVATPANSRTVNCFQARAEYPEKLGGAVVVMQHVGVAENEQQYNTRMLYSPDGGASFCPIAIHSEVGNTPGHPLGGKVYWGCAATFGNFGVRELTIPDVSTFRPIMLGPGGTNRLAASVTITNRAGAESTQTKVTAPTGCPALGECIHVQHTGASDVDICTIELGVVPQTTEVFKLQFWVRSEDVASWGATNPPFGSSLAPGSAAHTFTFSLFGSDSGTNDTSGASFSQFFVQHGQWTLVTILSHLRAWRPAARFTGAENQTISILLQCHSNSVPVPLDFYIGLDGLYAMPNTTGEIQGSYPQAPAAAGANELLTVSGLSLAFADGWQFYLHGKVGQWDATNPTSYNSSGIGVGTTTTTLGATASAVNDFYKNHSLHFTPTSAADNNPRGAIVSGYVGATKVLTHASIASTQGAITDVSVANPSVITSAGHGLAVGTTAVILSDLGTTPDINGAQTATRIDANTFSVPVDVTAVADGTGAWRRSRAVQVVAPRIDNVYTTPDRALFPLFSLSNTAGTEGITVFADTSRNAATIPGMAFQLVLARYSAGNFPDFNDYDMTNAVYLETAGGSSGGEDGEIYFMPDDPLHIAVSYDGTNGLAIVGSVGSGALGATGLAVDFLANDFTGVGALTKFHNGGLGTPTGESTRRVTDIRLCAIQAMEGTGTDDIGTLQTRLAAFGASEPIYLGGSMPFIMPRRRKRKPLLGAPR